jgi:site-specific recombinase XerD
MSLSVKNRLNRQIPSGALFRPDVQVHAHASHSLDRGASIHLVQTTLGHASIAITGTKVGQPLLVEK